MAELILTEEEKRTKIFLKWDDATLGKAVKLMADIIHDNYGKESLFITGAAVTLIAEAVKNNANTMEIDLTEATDGEINLGNWKITLAKTK